MTRLALFASALALSACCNGDVLCVGSLTLHLTRPATLPYHVEALSLEDSLLTTLDCTQTSLCTANSVTLLGVQDEHVVIRLSEGTLVSVDTLTPTYTTTSAHGCGSCFVGDATMHLAQ